MELTELNLSLAQALRIGSKDSVAFVGAGGKTTAMFQLARQLPPPVFLTTSTHLSVSQIDLADQHLIVRNRRDLTSLGASELSPVTLFTGPFNGSDRIGGLPEAVLDRLISKARNLSAPILIEADGSRLRPLKAPADHEPAIPSGIDRVVVVAGLSAIGRPLTDQWVHRPKIFANLSNAVSNEIIDEIHISRVLLHELGGLKGIPVNARRTVLLTQADSDDLRVKGDQIARQLLPTYESALVCSLGGSPDVFWGVENAGKIPFSNDGNVIEVHERITGIVLAAGGSKRFGRPKQLLDWRGEPLVRQVSLTALEAGLSPVVVITGAFGEQVRITIEDLPVTIVQNTAWETGQSSSVRAGLVSLPDDVGGAVFLLADQPQIPAGLVCSLLDKHRKTLSPIIAPLIDGQRGNPVLFDKLTFDDLQSLQGDTGGKALFSKYPIDWIEWNDSKLLVDVDTEADYERLRKMDR